MASGLAQSQEYMSFRSTVSQRKIVVDNPDQAWVLYDSGPREVKCPLIFLPPVCGTADCFFKQILTLSSQGYRVITVEYPVLWTVDEWCESFLKLINYLGLDKIHCFGASLGGFLAQKFAEKTSKNPRVASIFLCNSFTDTSAFKQTKAAKTFWTMPTFLLKRQVLINLPTDNLDPEVAKSIDFMVDRMDSLSRGQLASRLTLNCLDSYVEPQKLKDVYITVMDVFDESALSQLVKEELYKCYPDAKRAHLKDGGNFPYLSRSTEVDLHLQIHLRVFHGTRCCAIVQSMIDEEELKAIKGEPV